MRLMYDSIRAASIPATAKMVAGYADTIHIPQWNDAEWNRFPDAVKVRIVKKASTNDGHVLDVEIGDATPAEAPGWAQSRRLSGGAPTVYCNASTWPSVRSQFAVQGVPQPYYFIAKYDGDPTIPQSWLDLGCVAKQYQNYTAYDLSVVLDYWPGVDDMAFTPEDFRAFMWGNVFDADGNLNFAGYLKNHIAKLDASQAAILAAIQAATKDPAITLDAMRQIVNDAVAQHVEITGTIHVGPATT